MPVGPAGDCHHCCPRLPPGRHELRPDPVANLDPGVVHQPYPRDGRRPGWADERAGQASAPIRRATRAAGSRQHTAAEHLLDHPAEEPEPHAHTKKRSDQFVLLTKPCIFRSDATATTRQLTRPGSGQSATGGVKTLPETANAVPARRLRQPGPLHHHRRDLCKLTSRP